MPTTKKRINVSLSRTVERNVRALARRDQVPAATKAAELIENALELEEDRILSKIADERDQPGAKFVSYKKAWKMLS